MPGHSSRGNKNKVDGVDYAFALVGTCGSIVFLLIIITEDFSFLWSLGSHGRLKGFPGILIVVLCLAMSCYSFRKIFNTNKDE